ncbi:MAG: hypothetical protein Q7K26_05675 [bacterium]|nr:hypothetical protein [bacterium]
MSLEQPSSQEANKIFINKLRSEIDRLVKEGRITEEQGKGKLASAELLEKGFSNDPEYDARLFAGAGVYEGQEMIDLVKEKK